MVRKRFEELKVGETAYFNEDKLPFGWTKTSREFFNGYLVHNCESTDIRALGLLANHEMVWVDDYDGDVIP